MSHEKEPLQLNGTYVHYDSLIWQVPSWGVAIASGVIVAANEVGKQEAHWTIAVVFVQASILFFGAILLTALSIALYKYRIFQTASTPRPIPIPPFKQKPMAARYLQLAICLISGGLIGMTIATLLCSTYYMLIGLSAGILGWIVAEVTYKKIRHKIDAND